MNAQLGMLVKEKAVLEGQLQFRKIEKKIKQASGLSKVVH